jgi:hypothetical protein
MTYVAETQSLYQTPRKGKLSTIQKASIRANSGNRTLRELDAEFGGSHETIRTVGKTDGR